MPSASGSDSLRFSKRSQTGGARAAKKADKRATQLALKDAKGQALKRDHLRCRGYKACGSKKFLEVAHIQHLSRGGDDTTANLVTLCGPSTDPSTCHGAHHAGTLTIRGTSVHGADGTLIFSRDGREWASEAT